MPGTGFMKWLGEKQNDWLFIKKKKDIESFDYANQSITKPVHHFWDADIII